LRNLRAIERNGVKMSEAGVIRGKGPKDCSGKGEKPGGEKGRLFFSLELTGEKGKKYTKEREGRKKLHRKGLLKGGDAR